MDKYKRAEYNFKFSRYIKILCFRFCGIFPISRFLRAKIYRRLGVSIEKGVVRGCILLSHYYDVRNLKEHAYYRGEIHIGRNVYIGSNAVFTKPVTVGDGAVIGAGSVVNKDIPPYQVWAGVPVRFICNRYRDESEIPVDTDDFKPR